MWSGGIHSSFQRENKILEQLTKKTNWRLTLLFSSWIELPTTSNIRSRLRMNRLSRSSK